MPCIGDVEVAVLRHTLGGLSGRRHWKWRRKHLFGAMRVMWGHVPCSRPVAADRVPVHLDVHDVWLAFFIFLVAVGRLGRW